MSDPQISDLNLMSDVDAAVDKATAAGDEQTAALLRKTREEAARRRVANRELTEKLQQMQADYDALLANSSTSTERLKALADELEQAKKWQTDTLGKLQSANETVIGSLPERYRALVPEGLSPVELRAWLDRAVPVLSNPAPVPLEGGEGASKDRVDPTVAVDEGVAAMARMLGVDAQELAKRTKEDGNKRI